MKLAKGKTRLWVGEQRGRVVYTRGGSVGSPGVPKARELASEDAARAFLEAERDKKLADGFVMLDEDAGLDTPFTADGKPKKRAVPARYAAHADRVRALVRGGFSDAEAVDAFIDDLVTDELATARRERTARRRAGLTLDERVFEEEIDARLGPDDEGDSRSTLGELLREVARKERDAVRAQTPPDPCINDRIDAAFEALNGGEIVALQAAGFTQSDGWADANEIAAKRRAAGSPPRGACFFHEQDLERGIRGDGLHLTFGSYRGKEDDVEVGRLVVRALAASGVPVEWDESPTQRIRIPPFPWFRAPPE